MQAKQQRRMTAPASSLQPPEGGYQPASTGRPPSPLRNVIPNTFTGIDPDEVDNEDEHDRAEWITRSPSPSSSVSQMAASFARSVGTLVSNMAPRSPGTMPTDAELEAEAERERDRSRREAERILTREAEDRRQLEQRVLAMMESTKSLPPPPSRSQSLDPPSPSGSQKESGGWWAAAKNRLTPTKDLTPAQQVIQETKAREKEKKNGKGKEKEWPANGQAKYANPSFTSLVPPPQRRPVPSPSSPTSPTPAPSRPYIPHANMPPNLTPSPMRHDASSSSPREREKENPPLYAHFDETTGTLDVHVTLLTIAKRFEKLEKWTVGHVRALEERMGDVERWLVDKENEKEQSLHEVSASSHNKEEAGESLSEIREGLQELQSRVSSLGREMAKLATSPANLSQSNSARYAEISAEPLTPSSSFAIPSASSPRSVSGGYTARESTSPPMASSTSATGSTRLPYPTGDYASPPDSTLISQDVFTASPSSSIRSSKPRPVSGLPGSGPSSASTSYSNASFSSVSTTSSGLPAKGSDLPLPKASPRAGGRGSVSPTPRKRYTVALGGSVESDSESGPELGTAMFSSSEEGEDFGGDTIGKSAAAKLSRGKTDLFSTPTASYKEPRMRAQSAYGLSSIVQASPTTTAALGASRPSPIPHGRSRSIDRFGTGNFVDPLVLRKQSSGGGKEGGKEAGKPAGNGKVPVGQLVAFFDGDRK
ncbi:hypothetical protein DFH07DRAFT_811015 [Mycena maculata]|uniref:Uncharacterized protein n=1 Tax=Mycena maculata TaxID=230809 RepID=A0AAD7JLG9_9AGAR|nr:hypothetical protein DFH07DRAFT_811015 [Mycena maculata]